MRVSISYGSYTPECIRVIATDSLGNAAETHILKDKFLHLDAQLLTVAVFRKQDWTRELSIEVTSHDFSDGDRCTGTVIERHTAPVTVPATDIEYLDVMLLARDDDHDTYIQRTDTVAGTDCDDTKASVHPDQPEACTGDRDLDCDGKAGCADPECVNHACDDHDPCTLNDRCTTRGTDSTAECVGTLKECQPPDLVCYTQESSCTSDTGECVYTLKDLGATCDDSNACTQNDRCNGAGSCAGELLAPCVASDACHRSERNCPSNGTCVESVDGSKVNTPCTTSIRNGVCRTDGVCSSFPYIPSNFDPNSIPEADRSLDVHIQCGNTTNTFIFDSGNLSWTPAQGCVLPTLPTATVIGDFAVVPIRNLIIDRGRALRLTGPRPVILAVYEDATLSGDVLANARLVTAGVGGDRTTCGTLSGGDGVFSRQEGSGGGGGGFGTPGAAGGLNVSTNPGGQGGAAVAGTLEPLVGGCPGGTGGSANNGGTGGAGGGALQLAVAGTLRVENWVSVSGGGGRGGKGSPNDKGGGGGGGSGGGLLLEAFRLELTDQTKLTANGGSGAQGGGIQGKTGASGTDGSLSSKEPAPGGDGQSTGAAGGRGGAEGGAPNAGKDGGDNAGGGGGGGGVGVIWLHGFGSCNIPQSCNDADNNGCNISPKTTPDCP